MTIATESTFDLFPGAPDVAAGTKEEIEHIDVTLIEPDPDQPRRDADDTLAETIRQDGVLQPIRVRHHPDPVKREQGMYMIVFGERRWRGTIAAGRTTIPAMIRDESDDDAEARRLIQQIVENRSKPVPPVDFARAIARLRDLTLGASINQLATITGVPKSTLADALALADAPEPFKPLFADGVLSQSAAPIIRKFAEVPTELLDQAIAAAKNSWQWRQAGDAEKPVPLEDVTNVLDSIILRQLLEELPEALALAYHGKGGQSVEIGESHYALDPKLLQKVRQAAVDAAARDAAGKTNAPAPKSGKNEKRTSIGDRFEDYPSPGFELDDHRAASTQPPRETSSEKKAREKRERDAAAEAEQFKRYNRARPAILKAIAAAIKKAPIGSRDPLANAVMDLVVDTVHEFDGARTAQLVSRGTTAADLVRFIVMGDLLDSVETGALDFNGLPLRFQRLGLKIDLKALIDAAGDEKPATSAKSTKVKAAAKKPSPAKKKAGKR